MPAAANKPRPKSCLWHRWGQSNWGSATFTGKNGEQVRYNVCKGCFYRMTRPYTADPRCRLWAQALERAHHIGVRFDISVNDITVSDTCGVSGVKLVHRWRSILSTEEGGNDYAVLDMIDPAGGFTHGNVRCVSRAAAGLVAVSAGNLTEVGGE